MLLFIIIIIVTAIAAKPDEYPHYHHTVDEHFQSIATEIEKEQPKWIGRLADAIAIPSISASADKHPQVEAMVVWTQKLMESLGISCKQIKNKPEGYANYLPPVLFGELKNPKATKTVLIYGHVDVQPADISDGWDTEPFKLVRKNGKLYGRGTTDDKGPVVGWLNVIETMQKLHIDIPVNIKFVLEGMEESNSVGLADILRQHQHKFLADIDFVVISDSDWLGQHTPCIGYGLRGLAKYQIEISGPKQDLHSGTYGGTIHEPMNDMCWILSQLTDSKGKILIDGVQKMVAPLEKDELDLYANIDFDLNDYREDVGVQQLVSDSQRQILLNRWREPSLSIHGIEGAFAGKGLKTVIPARVVGKFSIRIVPDMEPEQLDRAVTDYLNKKWHERGSPNQFKVIANGGMAAWVGDFKHSHFKAGANAIRKVYGKSPDFIRDGGSIPITLVLEEVTKKNVLLLPMGASDDGAHSQNEKLNVSNYINTMKVFAAYFLELGLI